MASLPFASASPYRRPSLATIDALVSARLGPTRVQGNAQPACFNRQVAMYLAKHLAGWSTTCIGRFYNGRDHSTVIHGIQRIEVLRDRNPDVDALLSELKEQLARSQGEGDAKTLLALLNQHRNTGGFDLDELAEAIAERVWARIEGRLQS